VVTGSQGGSTDEIAARLATLPPEQRSALAETRARIAGLLPGAHEVIAWQMPTFRVGQDNVVSYWGFAEHNSIFPGAGVIAACAADLVGYPTTKGTIHVPSTEAFGEPLLRRLLTARIEEINASYPKRGGMVRAYHPDGTTALTGRMRAEARTGVWTWFDPDGTVVQTTDYGPASRTTRSAASGRPADAR